MRVTGEMIKQMVKEHSITPMEMCIRVSGETTRLMDGASTHMIMVPRMKATGKKINKMAEVQRLGLMVQNMLASTKMERNMEKAFFTLQTKVFTKVSSRTTKYQARASTHGTMAKSTRAAGIRIKWMGEEYSLGQMGSDMKENSEMINERGKGYSSGKTEKHIMGLG